VQYISMDGKIGAYGKPEYETALPVTGKTQNKNIGFLILTESK
jgi:hypothetical protein